MAATSSRNSVTDGQIRPMLITGQYSSHASPEPQIRTPSTIVISIPKVREPASLPRCARFIRDLYEGTLTRVADMWEGGIHLSRRVCGFLMNVPIPCPPNGGQIRSGRLDPLATRPLNLSPAYGSRCIPPGIRWGNAEPAEVAARHLPRRPRARGQGATEGDPARHEPLRGHAHPARTVRVRGRMALRRVSTRGASQ